MAEYINAKPLKKEIADLKRTIHSENTDYQTGYMSALSVVEGMIVVQPAADVEPVRHGHWTPHGSPPENIWCCSECKALRETAHYCNKCYYDYCPNCGAKMRGEENGK